MTNVRLTRRSLTRKEAASFSAEMRLTPNITGYPAQELVKLTDVLVVEVAGEAVGMLAYVETDTFIDLKILLVRTTERGKGFGKMLMATALKHFVATNKAVYTVTRNPIVVKLLTESGFVKTSFMELPYACKLHQLKMVFSIYRIAEALRKSRAFPHQPPFSYYIRLP